MGDKGGFPQSLRSSCCAKLQKEGRSCGRLRESSSQPRPAAATAPRRIPAPLQRHPAAPPLCCGCAQLHLRPAVATPRCSRAQLQLRPATVASRCGRAPLQAAPSCISASLRPRPAAAAPLCKPRPAASPPRYGRVPLRPRPFASRAQLLGPLSTNGDGSSGAAMTSRPPRSPPCLEAVDTGTR